MKIDASAFRRGAQDALTFAPLRWWLFKQLSAFGWWICPEPHKSRMQQVSPSWAALRERETQ